MLRHRLKPGESIFIRGEIEIKNTGETNAHLGFIGDGEVNVDAVQPAGPLSLGGSTVRVVKPRYRGTTSVNEIRRLRVQATESGSK
jgi:hypothetical protein